MISLEINLPKLQEIIDTFLLNNEQVDRAILSASRKMATLLNSEFRRGVKPAAGVDDNIVRRRLVFARVQRVAGSAKFKIWFGTNRIPLIYLRARDLRPGGVRAIVNRTEAKGFIAAARGKSGNGTAKQVFKRQGAERLKIDKVFAEIDESVNALASKLVGNIDDKFMEFFESEIQWRAK